MTILYLALGAIALVAVLIFLVVMRIRSAPKLRESLALLAEIGANPALVARIELHMTTPEALKVVLHGTTVAYELEGIQGAAACTLAKRLKTTCAAAEFVVVPPQV